MVKIFDRNMFIMLAAIMVGVIVVTYFIADIMRRSQIETLTIEHEAEMLDVTSRSENFTNHFLQGSVKMNAAREIREVGNYHFDFALFWYTNAVRTIDNTSIRHCIENCTEAMSKYLESYENFNVSQPLFEQAKTFTNTSKYIEILGYYVLFIQSGKNITMLRYTASQYLRAVAENLSLGQLENLTDLMDLFNQTEDMYNDQLGDYNDYGGQIDEFLFFDPIREPH